MSVALCQSTDVSHQQLSTLGHLPNISISATVSWFGATDTTEGDSNVVQIQCPYNGLVPEKPQIQAIQRQSQLFKLQVPVNTGPWFTPSH